jgi:hypothetical protein
VAPGWGGESRLGSMKRLVEEDEKVLDRTPGRFTRRDLVAVDLVSCFIQVHETRPTIVIIINRYRITMQ